MAKVAKKTKATPGSAYDLSARGPAPSKKYRPINPNATGYEPAGLTWDLVRGDK